MNKFILYYSFLLIKHAFSFDFYTLAVQNWCSDDNFLIHGLWPDNFNGSYPQNCNGPEYERLDILKDDLKKYWYDCNEKESEQLWEHQWNKHGKCIFQQEKITQKEYFNITINLFKKYKPKKNICFDLFFENIDCKNYSINE